MNKWFDTTLQCTWNESFQQWCQELAKEVQLNGELFEGKPTDGKLEQYGALLDKLKAMFDKSQPSRAVAVRATRCSVTRFKLKAPIEFLVFCAGGSWAGVQIEWGTEQSRQGFTMSNGQLTWHAMCSISEVSKQTFLCKTSDFNRVVTCLGQAHSQWSDASTIDKPNVVVMGKRQIKLVRLNDPPNYYKVQFHASLGRPDELVYHRELAAYLQEYSDMINLVVD